MRHEMPRRLVLLRPSQGEDANAGSRANERPGWQAREPVSIQLRPLWSFRASERILERSREQECVTREVRTLADRYGRQPPAIFHSPPCSRSLGLPARPSPGTPHACLIPGRPHLDKTRPPLAPLPRVPGADNVSCVTSQRRTYRPRRKGRWFDVVLRTEVSSSGSPFECIVVEPLH